MPAFFLLNFSPRKNKNILPKPNSPTVKSFDQNFFDIFIKECKMIGRNLTLIRLS